ncbi:MAG TPA: ribonuclease Y [bacterium]|nr:ribonuclease Y [bacterium]HOR57404.1 ribonuclease Y [bacterium]HPL56243.1 ribonuclease Y [bacterium]
MVLTIVVAAAGLMVGVLLGVVIAVQKNRKSLERVKNKSEQVLLDARNEALKIKEDAEKDRNKRQEDLKELEGSLRRREESLDKRSETLEKDRSVLAGKEKEIEAIRLEMKGIAKKREEEIKKISKLTKAEARDVLLKDIEQEYKDDLLQKIRQYKTALKEAAEVESRKILSTVIERYAGEVASEHTTMSVALPSEEMKGRIIGKEGRNIQIFEKVSGVDLIIDDTPDTVLISSFDPVRRHVAKVALERLIADSRINPNRIEEIVEKVNKETQKEIKEAGEKAVTELGITGFHPDLIKILGSLKYRTSFGQNILDHTLEVARIASMLAAEIGADINVVKKAAILHDAGKAVSHEVEGSHHHISGDIARRYGVSENVIHAAVAHHDDIEAKTVEALVVRAADAISGARPGARRESFENYVKRLTEIENIANSFEGVDKTFAIQAGREVRVIVRPDDVDDLGAAKLSKNIAKKIEESLQYPGVIKVNVIRETRSVEYAK